LRSKSAQSVSTLLLDSLFLPYQFINAKSAFLLLLKNAVKSIDAKDNIFDSNLEWFSNSGVILHKDQPFLRSKNQTWFIPTILVIKHYFHFNRKKLPKTYSLQKLCIIFDYECQICHETFDKADLTIEHILPKCKGGEKDLDNITLSCRFCNQAKKDMYPYFSIKNKELKTPPPGLSIPHTPNCRVQIRPEWEKFFIFNK
jgi:5-methylcytosine-specific restriction endonuclease McrA